MLKALYVAIRKGQLLYVRVYMLIGKPENGCIDVFLYTKYIHTTVYPYA